MANRKLNLQNIDVWHCGVIKAFEKEDGEKIAVPKFIYKVDNANKTCYWADIDQLYKYGLSPLTKTLQGWDDTFIGLSWNMHLCFLCPQMVTRKNPNPLPLDEDGTIPAPKEGEE